MIRFFPAFVTFSLFVAAAPVVGQVVETIPDPPRTDQPVTIYFNADEGTGGLANYDGEVYAHTGISTDQSPDKAWKCVKNYWPTNPNFTGNRDDTRLTQIAANRYKLEIQDIRAYYQDTSTSCSLEVDEEIQTMNFVFRNADGSKEGKAAGGDDIFVKVVDVSGKGPVVEASITEPEADPPLYPFMTATDTTVTVSISADTANVDSLSALRLFVDGTKVDSTTSTSLSYVLSMGTPNRFDIRAEAEAASGDSTIVDSTSTFLIRTPNVVDQPRPPGIHDGVNYNSNGSVTLSLYAPNKDFVYAVGDFTNWEIDGNYFMKRHQVAPDSTHWWITIDNLIPGKKYAFQYFVDGELRIGDPFAHNVLSPRDRFLNAQALGFSNLKPYPENKTENLVTVFQTDQKEFNFSKFQPPAQKDLVIYELLLRDFLERSSYATLTDTLDYLDRLGVNAIELMPVASFGGNVSWGYNPNFHFALDKAYGPPEDLKKFVEAAHNRGIAVILDVVYNHVTGQSPLVQLYGAKDSNPFLNVPASTPFSVFNQLDHSSPFVKNYLDRANEYWLEEFNVDGFRYDLAKGFVDRGGTSADRIDNLQRMADFVWDEVDSEAYVILELFASNREEQTLTSYRADETGGMMVWHNMNRPYSESSMGFVPSGLFTSDLSSTYHKNRGFTEPNLVTYMESHDEQWLMHRNRKFGNSSDEGYSVQNLRTALERQKLVGAFFFTVPGPRMVWQFGELGYGWARDECLKPGDGSNGECSASAPGRTAPKPIRWKYRDPQQSPDRVRLYKAWSAMIKLRQKNEVFTSTDTDVSMRVEDNQQARRIVLRHPTMNAVVVGNFAVDTMQVFPNFPDDTDGDNVWYDFFTGETVEVSSDVRDDSVSFAPGEYHIFTSERPNGGFPEPGLTNFGTPSAPLPVELTRFEATVARGQTVRLRWRTASETNNAGFQVQRRQSTESTWSVMGFVDGAGTTTRPQTYHFEDTQIPFSADSLHYRLKQIDADGTARFSQIATVALGTPKQLILRTPFPNPVQNQATVRYAVPTRQDVQLAVYDVLGRMVRTLVRGTQRGRREHRLDASEFASGTYILRLEAGTTVKTQRFTVIR